MEWADKFLPNVLAKSLCNVISSSTPIQQSHWSVALHINNRDQSSLNEVTVLTSPTGSGKTLAYLLPALCSLFKRTGEGEVEESWSLLPPVPGSPYIVIIAPTRELVVQVMQEAERISAIHPPCHPVGEKQNSSNINSNSMVIMNSEECWLKCLCLYGGVPPYHQRRVLEEKGVHMVVTTPGRLSDFLFQSKIKLDAVKYVVLDEYDRLFEKRIKHHLDHIMHEVQPKYILTVIYICIFLKIYD
jgi:superfamily II DNA/RNA helicase